MVRGLLQRLDQVVPVLGVYGPQRPFAYALRAEKTRTENKGRKIRGPLLGSSITNTAAHTDLSQQVPDPISTAAPHLTNTAAPRGSQIDNTRSTQTFPLFPGGRRSSMFSAPSLNILQTTSTLKTRFLSFLISTEAAELLPLHEASGLFLDQSGPLPFLNESTSSQSV